MSGLEATRSETLSRFMHPGEALGGCVPEFGWGTAELGPPFHKYMILIYNFNRLRIDGGVIFAQPGSIDCVFFTQHIPEIGPTGV